MELNKLHLPHDGQEIKCISGIRNVLVCDKIYTIENIHKYINGNIFFKLEELPEGEENYAHMDRFELYKFFKLKLSNYF